MRKQREVLLYVGNECHDCCACASWQPQTREATSGHCLDPDIGGMMTVPTGGGCRNHFKPRREAHEHD